MVVWRCGPYSVGRVPEPARAHRARRRGATLGQAANVLVPVCGAAGGRAPSGSIRQGHPCGSHGRTTGGPVPHGPTGLRLRAVPLRVHVGLYHWRAHGTCSSLFSFPPHQRVNHQPPEAGRGGTAATLACNSWSGAEFFFVSSQHSVASTRHAVVLWHESSCYCGC